MTTSKLAHTSGQQTAASTKNLLAQNLLKTKKSVRKTQKIKEENQSPAVQQEKLPSISLERLRGIDNLSTSEDLAKVLTWQSSKQLTWLCKTKNEHYSVLKVPKKAGRKKYRIEKDGKKVEIKEFRTIYNPDTPMRVAQFRVLTRILDLATVPDYIYAFEKGKSISSMAQVHVGKDVVISLDIKDFFPSITELMVRSLFQSLGISGVAGRCLSELCTYSWFVPQGALTSPKISNLIAAGTFGPEVKRFCDEQGITLTIYADDITMSFNRTFENLEKAKEYSQLVISTVTELVEKHGFRINRKKTKVMTPHMRQYVCGAVVNEKVNLRRTERLALRAIVRNLEKVGIDKSAERAKLSPEVFIRKVAGRINWLCQLNPDGGVGLKAKLRKVTTPYLKKFPDVKIPELSWASIEDPTPKEEYLKDAMQSPIGVTATTPSGVSLNL